MILLCCYNVPWCPDKNGDKLVTEAFAVSGEKMCRHILLLKQILTFIRSRNISLRCVRCRQLDLKIAVFWKIIRLLPFVFCTLLEVLKYYLKQICNILMIFHLVSSDINWTGLQILSIFERRFFFYYLCHILS